MANCFSSAYSQSLSIVGHIMQAKLTTD